jgi:hypothetical protein
MRRFLESRKPRRTASFLIAFLQAIAEAGYVEGQNLAIEHRSAVAAHDDRVHQIERELL